MPRREWIETRAEREQCWSVQASWSVQVSRRPCDEKTCSAFTLQCEMRAQGRADAKSEASKCPSAARMKAKIKKRAAQFMRRSRKAMAVERAEIKSCVKHLEAYQAKQQMLSGNLLTRARGAAVYAGSSAAVRSRESVLFTLMSG
eukprot:107180-Pleurochrysis_carterae.AAC.1